MTDNGMRIQIIIYVLLSNIYLVKAAFSWTTTPGTVSDCSGNDVTLVWDFTTDETVTAIQWFRNGVVVAAESGGSFLPVASYISKSSSGGAAAAIIVSNLSSANSGTYICRVSVTTDHSDTVTLTSLASVASGPSANVTDEGSGKKMLGCGIPADASASGTVYMWSGPSNNILATNESYTTDTCGTYNCSMSGGAAKCLAAGVSSYITVDITEFRFDGTTCKICVLVLGLVIWAVFVGLLVFFSIKSDVCCCKAEAGEKLWEKGKIYFCLIIGICSVIVIAVLAVIAGVLCNDLKGCDTNIVYITSLIPGFLVPLVGGGIALGLVFLVRSTCGNSDKLPPSHPEKEKENRSAIPVNQPSHLTVETENEPVDWEDYIKSLPDSRTLPPFGFKESMKGKSHIVFQKEMKIDARSKMTFSLTLINLNQKKVHSTVHIGLFGVTKVHLYIPLQRLDADTAYLLQDENEHKTEFRTSEENTHERNPIVPDSVFGSFRVEKDPNNDRDFAKVLKNIGEFDEFVSVVIDQLFPSLIGGDVVIQLQLWKRRVLVFIRSSRLMEQDAKKFDKEREFQFKEFKLKGKTKFGTPPEKDQSRESETDGETPRSNIYPSLEANNEATTNSATSTTGIEISSETNGNKSTQF